MYEPESVFSSTSKVLAAAAAVLLGWPLSASAQDGQAETQVVDGEWRYDVSCASCHGWEGEGIYAFGVPLRDNNFVLNAPDEALIQVVQEGRANRGRAYRDYPGMPGFEYIRGDEMRALIEYMRGPLQEREEQ